MQLQTTARCKGPPDGAGYRPPETRQQVTQPGRPDAQGPPPAGWPGRGLGARPQYAIRGRGNKFVQLQAINRYLMYSRTTLNCLWKLLETLLKIQLEDVYSR